jgi:hypothetical protein
MYSTKVCQRTLPMSIAISPNGEPFAGHIVLKEGEKSMESPGTRFAPAYAKHPRLIPATARAKDNSEALLQLQTVFVAFYL